jgi:hypothetical protein
VTDPRTESLVDLPDAIRGDFEVYEGRNLVATGLRPRDDLGWRA